MKKFWKQFFVRGLMVASAGPLVMAVVHAILGACGVVDSITPVELAKGIVSVTLVAFLAGGVTAVYTLEQLPYSMASLIHGAVLYASYLMMYLVNGWMPRESKTLIIFTVVFVVLFAIIWIIVYQTNKRAAEKVSKKLAQH